jgi:hypothetical protein
MPFAHRADDLREFILGQPGFFIVDDDEIVACTVHFPEFHDRSPLTDRMFCIIINDVKTLDKRTLLLSSASGGLLFSGTYGTLYPIIGGACLPRRTK